MIVCKKIIILVFTFLINMPLFAQILEPAKWSYNVSSKSPKQGDIVEIVFNIELDDTWVLYSNVQNYELGPLPAVFEFEPNSTYQLIGELKPIGSKAKYDDVFEVNVNYFEHTAEFIQKVKLLSKNPVIRGAYEYQVCSLVDGRCIMGDDEFEFEIKTE